MQRRELLRTLGWTAVAASIIQNVDLEEQKHVASVLSKPSRWGWPLSGTSVPDAIGSPFGPRLNFGKYNFHEGIDLRSPEGTAVHAAAAGRIHRLTDDAGCLIHRANESATEGCEPQFSGGGRIVAIDHGHGLYTTYFHLSRQADGLQTRTPTAVRLGQVIGFVGQTGRAESGPHLHFEARTPTFRRTDTKNPMGYLPHAHPSPPEITHLSTGLAGTTDVSVTVTLARTDMDLNNVTVRVLEGEGRETDARHVAFNERDNCGRDLPAEVNSIRLEPAEFTDQTDRYSLTVVFIRMRASSPGSFEAAAHCVSGLSHTTTLPIEGK